MQPLGVGRLVVALGLKPGVARRAPEHLEERTGDAAIRKGDGALALGREGERLGDRALVAFPPSGQRVEGVGQHLGLEPAHRITGEELRRTGRIALGDGRLLVGGRVHDQPHQLPQVELRSGEFLFQKSQQCGIHRRVGGPDVVRFVDDAAAEEPGPGTVGHGPREPRVAGCHQPVGEHVARVVAGRDCHPRAIGQDGP